MADFFHDWRNPVLVVAIIGAIVFGILWMVARPSTAFSVGSHYYSEGDVVKELKAQHGFQVVHDMITTALLEEYATARGITVSPDEVEQLVTVQKNALELQENSTSLDDYLKTAGLTLEAFRKGLYAQALQVKLLLTPADIAAAVSKVAKQGTPPFTIPPRYKFRFFVYADEGTAKVAVAGLAQNSAEGLNAAVASSLNSQVSSRDQVFLQGMKLRPQDAFIATALQGLRPGEVSRPIKLSQKSGVVAVIQLKAIEPAVTPSVETCGIAAGYLYMKTNWDKYAPKLRELEGQALDKSTPSFDNPDYDNVKNYFMELKKRNPQLPDVPLSVPGGATGAAPVMPSTAPAPAGR